MTTNPYQHEQHYGDLVFLPVESGGWDVWCDVCDVSIGYAVSYHEACQMADAHGH